jgi:hypothetical protein
MSANGIEVAVMVYPRFVSKAAIHGLFQAIQRLIMFSENRIYASHVIK